MKEATPSVPRTPTSAGSSCAHQRGGNTQSSALSDGRNGYARQCTQFVSDVKNKLHSVQNNRHAHATAYPVFADLKNTHQFLQTALQHPQLSQLYCCS